MFTMTKLCPKCLHQYEDDSLETCPDDGTLLRSFTDRTSQLVGTVLDGRWEIKEKIGEGGMGEVYRARQVNVDRVVAVKVLRPALTSSDQYVVRFFREADIATSVQHPHFVSIFDFGQSDDLLYITMELLEGHPLARVLRETRLGMEKTLMIACQVCAAMAAAHERRIVHRDLKPDNIFLIDVPEGGPFVKVLDFGIAKNLDSTNKVTRTGQLFGTPEYMSPEQCEGNGRVDGRSDLYALGCILYETITGDSPFERDSIIQTLLAQVSDEPPSFEELGIPVPDGVARIIFRLLEKHPDNRFGTAIEAREAFEEQLAHLRRHPAEVAAYDRVSKTLQPRERMAKTVSYQDLGHPLQLEGALADSARSAIAHEAEKRRQYESEQQTDRLEGDGGISPVGVVFLLTVIAAAIGAGVVISNSGQAEETATARARALVDAESQTFTALGAARRQAASDQATRHARWTANHVVIGSTTLLLTPIEMASNDRPRPKPRPRPRPKKPAEPIGAPLVGVRTQTSMERRLLGEKRQLLNCYNRREDTKDGGEVIFRLTVSPNGSVSNASVTSNELRSATALACMKNVASRVEFAAAETSATLVKSLSFKSRAQ